MCQRIIADGDRYMHIPLSLMAHVFYLLSTPNLHFPAPTAEGAPRAATTTDKRQKVFLDTN
jgi:hypothetical protein